MRVKELDLFNFRNKYIIKYCDNITVNRKWKILKGIIQ